MIYYTSDMHFGSEFIMQLTNRPFKTIEEMNETLIKNWNDTVNADDTVYILGDMALNSGPVPKEFLKQLNGHKHLVRGNHDVGLDNQEELFDYVESVSDFLETDDGDFHILLCHYPIFYEQKGYMIHGHLHNLKGRAYEILKDMDRILNAGVDVNGFKPVTLNELIENNKKFYADESLAIDPAERKVKHKGWKPDFRPIPVKYPKN